MIEEGRVQFFESANARKGTRDPVTRSRKKHFTPRRCGPWPQCEGTAQPVIGPVISSTCLWSGAG